MEKLSKDWVTDGLIDFEYKKYLLLGYLQHVQKEFNKVELYPSLSDLVTHYHNLTMLKKNQLDLEGKFPKQLQGLDFKKLKLIYQKLADNNDVMSELEAIIEFALPRLKRSIEEGKEIYEFIEEHCEFSPVGLLPLYVDEGYLFINNDSRTETNIYRYQLSRIQSASETYRGIHTSFIEKANRRIGESLESLKMNLAKKFKELPNPATFSIDTNIKVPFVPTLVPIAKRFLVKYVAAT